MIIIYIYVIYRIVRDVALLCTPLSTPIGPVYFPLSFAEHIGLCHSLLFVHNNCNLGYVSISIKQSGALRNLFCNVNVLKSLIFV